MTKSTTHGSSANDSGAKQVSDQTAQGAIQAGERAAQATTGVSETPKALSPEETKERELPVDSKAILQAVHGRIVHPFNVPMEFDTDSSTVVVVDRWMQIQYGAGKLRKVTLD